MLLLAACVVVATRCTGACLLSLGYMSNYHPFTLLFESFMFQPPVGLVKELVARFRVSAPDRISGAQLVLSGFTARVRGASPSF